VQIVRGNKKSCVSTSGSLPLGCMQVQLEESHYLKLRLFWVDVLSSFVPLYNDLIYNFIFMNEDKTEQKIEQLVYSWKKTLPE